MEATRNLTQTQARLNNELKAAGIQPEIKAKNEVIENHNNGELYVAFQGRKVYAQKGGKWLLTDSVTKVREFIIENN